MSLVIPVSREQCRHVSTGMMTGIHDVFPADDINSNDPISEKKLKQLDGEYSTKKTILDLILMEPIKLFGWKRVTKEFETVVARTQHAFNTILVGWRLLSPCNKVPQSKPLLVYLQRNPVLQDAIMGFWMLLWESSKSQTRYRELIGVGGWPGYISCVMLCPMVSAA